MSHSVRIFESACKGCVNCLKSCPTEAIRVVDGSIRILPDLCIDCGECLRTCGKKALGLEEDDWDLIRSHTPGVLAVDPTFFAQFGAYWHPSMVIECLREWGLEMITTQAPKAFDLAAYAVAAAIDTASREQLPLISTYCPSVVRLIQVRFPELLGRLVPVQNPLDIMGDLWRRETLRDDPITLLSPCPSKITLVRNPVSRSSSPFQHVVSVRKVTRQLLAAGPQVADNLPDPVNKRWLKWALRGGEARHVRAFSPKPIVTLAVSGLRNTLDLLQDLELGRLAGVDFVECRICDLGCIGGIANAESRFLASLRLQPLPAPWEIEPSEREELAAMYESGIWALEKPVPPRPRIPLSENLTEAMAKLKEMKAIYAELPHIDCGSCGRPSCNAMAEDIVRGEGEITDCIFKLRDEISDLANRIVLLSKSVPHTMKGRS
ncbi:iron only hydrogenase large subunit [Thermanaerovibrio velox DSM 12556]|uniref:Iron only hydrogenase large subunit n=1 Tax=Thermanaerovibrio velox DSM 12556 TaxID=926567 RepID=H0USE0_9BACT|nr:[Fe-Fe] hydrogenase large subunit C-terminal domain-containing protein [Thermanaerovibrio velox]EHM10229.1 iron only hydrogenase large subunit [Thermanaerovibrio velox DSM 12556]